MQTDGRVSSEELSRARAKQEAISAAWRKQVYIGAEVVLKSAGITGVVREVKPWGVEVWANHRGQVREFWSWEQILKRRPRSIKRYPRLFRFPRLTPSVQCHCKSGAMERIKGRYDQVRCKNKRCQKLIGNEAFPSRFRNATKLLYEAALANQKRKGPAKRAVTPKRKVGTAVPSKWDAPYGKVDVRPARPAAKRKNPAAAKVAGGKKAAAAKKAIPKTRTTAPPRKRPTKKVSKILVIPECDENYKAELLNSAADDSQNLNQEVQREVQEEHQTLEQQIRDIDPDQAEETQEEFGAKMGENLFETNSELEPTKDEEPKS